MITKTINLYTFNELSQKAKDKAREKWNYSNDYPFLQDDLREYIHEELKERGLKEESKITPFYRLSYSQGDGLMFEGVVSDKKGNTYTIKHSGYYYHERSTNITGVDKNNEEIDTMDFEENIYIPICKIVRDRGYNLIDWIESEEYFRETCEANEYLFREDGTIENID